MDKIGKYELIRVIGSGATATVYLAYDPSAQRQVAIKVANPEVLKNPERSKIYTHLFLNEASLIGKLSHPYIIQIYDAVVTDDLCYIVMEHVEGGTLDEYCTVDSLLPISRVIEIIFKCSRALDFAHHLGITHRDIKPANILFSGDSPNTGNIKISDFGAALVDSPERTQVSGIGSPAYMSPEQLRELPLNHQTDIYSLGVVMFQLLTGQLPFQADTNYNMVYQIIHTDPPKPSSLRNDIPDSIDIIVARAMHKKTSQRYPSWEEFGHDLAQVFHGKKSREQKHSLADSEKFSALRALAFFTDFSDVELWEVLEFAHWRDAAAEETILREGDPDDFFCLLVEGDLDVRKNGVLLHRLTTGDCFGEMALIGKGEQVRGASVVALTSAKIISLENLALRQASEACRMHFYQSFLEVMNNRLTAVNAGLSTV